MEQFMILKKKVISNRRQLLEIIGLSILFIVLLAASFTKIFDDFLQYVAVHFDAPIGQIVQFVRQFAPPPWGGRICSVLICLFAYIKIRKYNKGYVMNRMLVYHDYSYAWYWICAKILGIEKCNLVLVPIYMQYKLVIRATFCEYPLNESDYPPLNKEIDISVLKVNSAKGVGEVNLVLEDTYAIKYNQIPESKREFETIKISRNNGIDCTRHFSQDYIDKVIAIVRNLDDNTTVNLFSTTNPLNTIYIAKRAFGLDVRGNVRHLYVFQQGAKNNRMFEDKGWKIF